MGLAPSSPDRYTRHNPPEGRRLKISIPQDDSPDTGDFPVRRFAMTALTLSLMLGLSLAQDPKKDETKPEAKPADASKPEAKPEAPKDAAKEKETPKAPVELPLPTIPPEVEAKREAALHAIADLIVAAQDANLVETTIDPPPILDLLVNGYAIDKRDLTATPKRGVSPEVFAAWFTGFGNRDLNVNYEADVRIVQPSKGLKKYYDTRAQLLNKHIEMVRKAKLDAKAATDTDAKTKAEAEAKKKVEDEAKAKAEAEAKKKAEDEAKAKAEAEKAKAAVEAKAKAEAEAKAKAEADKPKDEPKKDEAPK
jgi:hypothetical protein